MIMSVWGEERRMEEVRRLTRHRHTCVPISQLMALDLSLLDALILPVHGVQGRRGDYMDKAHISLPEGFWECLREDCRIISGMPSAFLDSLPQPKYYYMQDEAYARRNAQLTAQGVLFYVLDHLDQAMNMSSVDIIGKGTCGKAIGSMLSQNGMRIRYVRHEETNTPGEVSFADWVNGRCADLIIQTAPAALLREEQLRRWAKQTKVIDIASVKTVDERLMKRYEIPYLKAGNIPELFAWKSAGANLYAYVKKVLDE